MYSVKNVDTELTSPKPSTCHTSICKVLIPSVLLPLLLIAILFIYMQKTQYQEAQEEIFLNASTSISSCIQQHLSPINNITMLLEDNNEIRHHMHSYATDNSSLSSWQAKEIEPILSSPYTYDTFIDSASVNAVVLYINNQAQYCSFDSSYAETKKRCNSVATYYIQSKCETSSFFSFSGSNYIYYIQDFRDIYSNQYYGYFLFELTSIPDSQSLHNTDVYRYDYKIDLTSMNDLSYYVWNSSKQIILSNNDTYIRKNYQQVLPSEVLSDNGNLLSNSNKWYIHTEQINDNLTLCVIAPIHNTFIPGSYAILLFLLMLIIIAGVCYVFIYTKQLYNEVYRYFETSREYPLSAPVVNPTCEEERLLFSIIRERIDDVTVLQKEYNTIQLQMRDSKIQNLEYQMNPHFIFNALDTIHWQAVAIGATDIQDSITNLANMLQMKLQSSAQKHSLREEFNFLDNYLSYQKETGRISFEYTMNLDSSLLDQYYILTNILQPIAENCIQHGFKRDSTPDGLVNTIVIELWEDIEDIYIRISDNGVGCDSSRVFNKDASVSQSHNHIALKNVNDRLQMYYGKSHSITMTSTFRIGTIVTINIPFDINDKEQAQNN